MNRNTLWIGATAICGLYGWTITARAADPQAINLATNGTFEQADPEAFNNPGDPQKIVLQSKEVKLVGGKLEIPPASACILVLPAK